MATILFACFKGLLVLAAAFVLSTRLIPMLWTRVGRLLGFRMKLAPLTKKRILRFKSIRRGYIAFLVLVTLSTASVFLEVLVNHRPLVIRFGDNVAYPALRDWGNAMLPGVWFSSFDRSGDFGIPGDGPLDYEVFARCIEDPSSQFPELIQNLESAVARDKADFEDLRQERAELLEDGEDLEEFDLIELRNADKTIAAAQAEMESLRELQKKFVNGEAGVTWAFLNRNSPSRSRSDLPKSPFPPQFFKPEIEYLDKEEGQTESELKVIALDPGTVFLGTDPSGVDLIPQLAYGFRVSIAFATMVLTCGYFIGILMGALMGYYGGWLDILVQRFIEIWSSIPFLFTIMILIQVFAPSFMLLAVLLILLTAWISISYLMRGEFYREKARDYVHAAIGTGVSDWTIITRHILPNSLVPIISRAPFDFVGFITALVSLDYLGFGLPADIPSWGALLRQGSEMVSSQPSLILIPVTVFAMTLFMVVLIGEAVREAFDPKVFSRLR